MPVYDLPTLRKEAQEALDAYRAALDHLKAVEQKLKDAQAEAEGLALDAGSLAHHLFHERKEAEPARPDVNR